MANTDHITILKHHSRDEWNLWRLENVGTIPDLQEADLATANLHGASLAGARTDGARLPQSARET